MTREFAPYISYPGTAQEALEFYHSIFGGEITASTFADAGVLPGEHPLAGKCMHAELRSDYVLICASDALIEIGAPAVTEGSNVSLAVMIDDEALGAEIFNKLADGGAIEMPYEKQIWGDVYGAVTDRFNIPWMVNAHTDQA